MIKTSSKPKKKGRSKSFGHALKLDISRERELISEKWEVKTGKSLLMNPTRQKIYRYLCEYPCSSLSTLSHDFEISPASMSWHVKLLIDRKLLAETRQGGRRLFYPFNMIDKKTISVLCLLANPKINNIFVNINGSPGIAQKELADKLGFSHQSIYSFTSRLKGEEMIEIVQDGKYTRYYPSKRLTVLEVSQRKNLKEFKNWVIKAFKYDGVNPKLVRTTDKLIILQITSGAKVESIKLSVNPFYSIIQDKKLFLAEL